jgi:hypothetical protein
MTNLNSSYILMLHNIVIIIICQVHYDVISNKRMARLSFSFWASPLRLLRLRR